MDTFELRRRWLCGRGWHSWRTIRQEKLGRTISYCRRCCGVPNRVEIWDPELWQAWHLEDHDH